MSYPEPRYLGDQGELSASIRTADAPADLVFASGTRVHYLATGAGTNGQYGMYRYEMGPEAGGPGPHFHRTMSESFYVLTGTIKIYDGSRWVDTGPGDFVHVPEGGVHGFRNESGEAATMLLHFSPGGPREGYFEGLAEFAMSGMPSDEELAAFYLLHDNHWV
ncbi:cupin [Microtetraspora sp. NBRC 13810]|uniref:cupin domain-containing protein n=1 Tax=Microtetraspora sp. NBRC 13810 TaxID=3030990 RepID=UPI0024A277D1|nr:cupin domain-containing protein [Microtetraspora sp. NBRC 13810]GLW11898.1 cupin [Microtetraspora sp. NBRC 13810]